MTPEERIEQLEEENGAQLPKADSAPLFPESTPRSQRLPLVWKKLRRIYTSKTVAHPWRCHRRSVSGWTMNRTCFQVRTIFARNTRSMRTILSQTGRVVCRRRIISCWRRSAFSATSSDLLLARSVSVPTMREVAVSGLVQLMKWW